MIFAVLLHLLSLIVGNIRCWTSGVPAGGHHQHHRTEGSAPRSQTRAVQSHRGSSCYTDETLEPAAVQLRSPQEEAAGGSGALQKGENTFHTTPAAAVLHRYHPYSTQCKDLTR